VYVTQREVTKGHSTVIKSYVHGLYGKLKFLNVETLEQNPSILAKVMLLMNLKTESEKAEYRASTLRYLKYCLSQRRHYSKKRIMEKYQGKFCAVSCLFFKHFCV
jgi:hypothetical protein